MRQFDFDEVIDRRGTHCTKWEFHFEDEELVYGDLSDPKHGDKRLLPLWVADMDFKSPPAVIEALVKRAQHGVYGYATANPMYYETVIEWVGRRYNWHIKRDWIQLSPGVVPAINMIIQEFVVPGEKVLVQRPVYYPFFNAIENNGAEIVSNTLVYANGRYHMDFDDLAQKAADPDVKLAILCSPHNPIGRVWTREELMRFGEICLANNVLVIADEIHCDLIYPDQTFTTFATLSEAFAQNSFTCVAPSKTFNLAGIKLSNIIIPNPNLRERFVSSIERNGVMGVNAFAIVAAEAAYTHGEPWREAVMDYIADNYHFMETYLAEHVPQFKPIPPEGTYLVWVDCSALGLNAAERKQLFLEKANIFIDNGQWFGPEGEQFERFNIACPRSILEETLMRIKQAVGHLESAH